MELTRRGFLGSTGGLLGMASLARPTGAFAGAPATVLSSQALPAADPLVHLMNRTSFGIRASDLEWARAIGRDGYLDLQLNPGLIDDTEAQLLVREDYPSYFLPRPVLARHYAPNQMQNKPPEHLRGVTLYLGLHSKRQLFEVMVDFWTNHFNIQIEENRYSKKLKLLDDRDVIRPNALGHFPALALASATSPAMILYLDTAVNRVGAPNENYARELCELHTLGAMHYHTGPEEHVPGFYTEFDVKEIARCFTGWGFDASTGEPTFTDKRHDWGQKRVLGQVIQSEGQEEVTEVVARLTTHPGTAKHISWKLARRFVSDDPPPALVDDMAGVYMATGGHIPSMLRTLFDSAEFDESRDEKFMRPVDYLLAVCRVLDAEVQRQKPNQIVNLFLRDAGQVPFAWDTPDGYPDTATYWISANGVLRRWQFGFFIGERGYSVIQTDPAAFIAGATTAAELVDRVAARVLRRPLLPEDRDDVVSFVADGREPDATLTTPELESAVDGLLGLLVTSAYFQLR